MRRSDSLAPSEALAELRARLNGRDMSEKVRKAWLFWARSMLTRYPDRDPASLSADEVRQLVDAMTQHHQINDAGRRQALEAIHFFLSEVLGVEDGSLDGLVESALSRREPVILSPAEVQMVLDELEGSQWLMASLVYGAGLRLLECVRLRIRDLKGNRIVVCDVNGRPTRETPLPERVRDPLRAHLDDLKLQHIRELADGFGAVRLPPGVRAPAATARAWIWQFVFPGPYMSEPGRSSTGCQRHHVPEPEVRQAIEQAARRSDIGKAISASTLRNSFAAHLIRRGVAVSDVEKLLGIEKSNTAHPGRGNSDSAQSVAA